MNKKTLLQLLILLITFLTLLAFFFTYFYKGTQKNKLTENLNVKLRNESSIQSKDTASIIENIKYLSFDSSGNQYEITAETGKIKNDDSEIIYMKKVTAKLIFINSENINIQANSAKYNSKSYETYFSENIVISYQKHKIECEKLDLLFKKNLALLYDNVIFTNPETKLFADRLEIDLITKNSKISMNNSNKKIKIVYNK